MSKKEPVNILLVDDQPAKLLAYEVILKDLGENLISSSSGREALEHLLKTDIALLLVDVCMPGLDGFELAAMIREHPRFRHTAIIFISAIQVTDLDRLRGYEMGAVDYVPVPVVPEVLRAKVRVFSELYRKTRELERLNTELEERVRQRTAELEASTSRLLESERRRNLAIAAGNMGSFDWDFGSSSWMWDEGQHRIFGTDPAKFNPNPASVQKMLHPEDSDQLRKAIEAFNSGATTYEAEFRVRRPNGEVRWCVGTAAIALDHDNRVTRVSGVTLDITERKEAEQRQTLLAREVDHRAKNALALVQSVVRLTRAPTVKEYATAIEGRIAALARVHTILASSKWQGGELLQLAEEELTPYRIDDPDKITIEGPRVVLAPASAQTLALAIHELATNAVKYGALSSLSGKVQLTWTIAGDTIKLNWQENGGPPPKRNATPGFGTRSVIASIQTQLCGHVEFNWREEGLECSLEIPHAVIEREQKASVSRSQGNSLAPAAKAGSRVLVVEDEAIVALEIVEMLSQAGHSVVGPFSRISEALAAARSASADFAILDINLGGELVYPVAEVLSDAGVPFIFTTGYGFDAVHPRFGQVHVLQKPIERAALFKMFSIRDEMTSSVGKKRAVQGPDSLN